MVWNSKPLMSKVAAVPVGLSGSALGDAPSSVFDELVLVALPAKRAAVVQANPCSGAAPLELPELLELPPPALLELPLPALLVLPVPLDPPAVVLPVLPLELPFPLEEPLLPLLEQAETATNVTTNAENK